MAGGVRGEKGTEKAVRGARGNPEGAQQPREDTIARSQLHTCRCPREDQSTQD